MLQKEKASYNQKWLILNLNQTAFTTTHIILSLLVYLFACFILSLLGYVLLECVASKKRSGRGPVWCWKTSRYLECRVQLVQYPARSSVIRYIGTSKAWLFDAFFSCGSYFLEKLLILMPCRLNLCGKIFQTFVLKATMILVDNITLSVQKGTLMSLTVLQHCTQRTQRLERFICVLNH